MEIFANDPLVRSSGLPTSVHKHPASDSPGACEFVSPATTGNSTMGPVDLVIDVSGNPEVGEYLQDIRRMGVSVIGGASAKFMWQLIEARIRATADIERP